MAGWLAGCARLKSLGYAYTRENFAEPNSEERRKEKGRRERAGESNGKAEARFLQLNPPPSFPLPPSVPIESSSGYFPARLGCDRGSRRRAAAVAAASDYKAAIRQSPPFDLRWRMLEGRLQGGEGRGKPRPSHADQLKKSCSTDVLRARLGPIASEHPLPRAEPAIFPHCTTGSRALSSTKC